MRQLFVAAALVLGAPAFGGEAPSAAAALKAGILAYDAGNFYTAREELARARALAPNWALPHLHWAMAEIAVDPTSPGALAALEQAVALAPANPRAHYYLGLTSARIARYDEAQRELERALELRHELTDARFALAEVHAALGRRAEATAELERIVAQEPAHLGALAALARLYEEAGRAPDAERALVSIATLQPAVAYHHYQLAQFYQRIGAAEKARLAYQRAEEIDPRPKRRMRRLH